MRTDDHHLTVDITRAARRELALTAERDYGDPSRLLTLVGVTGTNGKTTITYLLESIWRAAGMKTGVIGTVEHRVGDRRETATHTTPPPPVLGKLLRAMVDEGVKACALEVSSHGLDQERVAGLHFDAAIFTNLTRDHLDYHHDMETYFAAKARLFGDHLSASCKAARCALVNVDDPYGARLSEQARGTVWRYGFQRGVEVHCRSLDETAHGLTLQLATPRGELKLRSALVGRFNAANIMAAAAAAQALGVDRTAIETGVARMAFVPGRFEAVANNAGISAFVDYAHTPDALEHVLGEARRLAHGKVIVVFGCGGDRDHTKRPLMGKIAAQLADVAIVTSDNPRSENPEAIIREIVADCSETGAGLLVVVDRREAITRAAKLARAGDVIVVAGKGHEAYQIIGQERRSFDDREELRRCLS